MCLRYPAFTHFVVHLINNAGLALSTKSQLTPNISVVWPVKTISQHQVCNSPPRVTYFQWLLAPASLFTTTCHVLHQPAFPSQLPRQVWRSLLIAGLGVAPSARFLPRSAYPYFSVMQLAPNLARLLSLCPHRHRYLPLQNSVSPHKSSPGHLPCQCQVRATGSPNGGRRWRPRHGSVVTLISRNPPKPAKPAAASKPPRHEF